MPVIPYHLLCRQTVTVYNRAKVGSEHQIFRTVIHGAFLDQKRQWQESKTGATATSPFLLVIPQGVGEKTFVEPPSFAGDAGTYTLSKGDKVAPGEGPEILSDEEWAELLPSKVAGLVTIGSYDLKLWTDGTEMHVEAGG